MLPPNAKPYLVRAIYDWCLAEGHTPYVLVAAAQPGVRFPAGYEKDGRITLNIAPRAVDAFEMGLDRIRFMGRFGGQVHGIEVPMNAVIAVFAAETHDGLVFGDPPAPPTEPSNGDRPTEDAGPEPEPPATPKAGSPRLRLVK